MYFINGLLMRPVRVVTTLPCRFISQEHEQKQLVDKPTPFQVTKKQCIICRSKIEFDYKNPRLLSQFVSSLTGRVYDKHVTGLCETQQTNLEREIKKSRRAMLMPKFHKDPAFNKDPPLFNPDKPSRPNPY